jgi:hypothetical protein
MVNLIKTDKIDIHEICSYLSQAENMDGKTGAEEIYRSYL